ncbi:MAG: hypothetical protein SCALA702_37390 [Melioribacteraceae bacterium]|nr:MAG: hypothetical protein SCALA702_37390 [Melioribacteraceae bacterium]
MKKLTLIITCVLLLTFTVKAQDMNFNNKLRLAQSYERSGLYEKAVEKYQELIKIQPFNKNLIQSLNDIYVTLKEYDKAIQLIEEQLADKPYDVSLASILGSNYYVMGNEDKAYEVWDNAIGENNTSASTYRVVANAAIRQRAFGKAVDILQRGKENTNNPTMFQYDLAQIYNVQMKYADATREYCEVLLKDEKQINMAKQRIGGYLESHGAFDNSIEVVEEFAENTGLPVYYDLLSGLYIRMGKFEEAYDIIAGLDDDKLSRNNLLYNFANTAMREGAFGVAAKAYKDYVDKNEESNMVAAARINYAAALKGAVHKQTETKDWKRFSLPDTADQSLYKPVVDAYKNLIEKYSGQLTAFQAQYNLAIIYEEEFLDYKSAKELYNTVTSRVPLSDIAGESWLRLGRIAVLEGDLDNAEKGFSNSLFGARTRQEIKDKAKFELGKLYMWQGNFTKSVNFFAQLSANPANDFANDALNYSLIINTFMKDSVSLALFAEAGRAADTYNFDSAAELFGELAENPQLMLLNELAEMRKGEMLLASGKLNEAINVFDNIINNEESESNYKDEALFFLAEIYRNELGNDEHAADLHEKLLENFPHSLYLDKSREIINALNINKNKTI